METELPDAFMVRTDRVIAQTLLRNLTDNAVKHARTRVRLSATTDAARATLLVEDDGPGIADEALGSPSGGLGLRLCRDLGHRIGAELTVGRSDSLGGAAFRLTLPLDLPSS